MEAVVGLDDEVRALAAERVVGLGLVDVGIAAGGAVVVDGDEDVGLQAVAERDPGGEIGLYQRGESFGQIEDSAKPVVAAVAEVIPADWTNGPVFTCLFAATRFKAVT